MGEIGNATKSERKKKGNFKFNSASEVKISEGPRSGIGEKKLKMSTTTKDPVRCLITGAAGQVGSRLICLCTTRSLAAFSFMNHVNCA